MVNNPNPKINPQTGICFFFNLGSGLAYSSHVSGTRLHQYPGNIGGNGVFNCDQISNGQTTNFVNVAYPEFDSSDSDETCSFLLVVYFKYYFFRKHQGY